jgi:putative transposase/transposase-like zinc-binding protein
VPASCRHGRRPRRAELADIVRAGRVELSTRRRLTSEQRVALAAIARCRTPEMGGHVEVCSACGHRHPVYRSCCNRHCPKCSTLAKERWLAARLAELVPGGYIHVVFTLPHALNRLAQRHPRAVYEALFRSASATLLEFARDPRHLGAQPGITAILHTWTQRLDLHVHLHCIVTAGGLDSTGRRWIKTRHGFLFPVHALSRVFRGKYLEQLRALLDESVIRDLVPQLYHHEWVVYAKAPPAGPAALLDYLARYTHRVALTNDRILGFDGRTVRLRWRDSEHHNKKRVLVIEAITLLSRFVLHVLPRGFKRVRHYGLLAPAQKASALAACRRYFGQAVAPTTRVTVRTLLARLHRDLDRCVACGSRTLRRESLPDLPCRAPPRAVGRGASS